MIKVGIVGATGYMGGEVLRVLLKHPDVHITWVSSRQGGDIAQFHPNLFGTGIQLTHPDEITPVDAAFIALPTEASINMTQRLLNMGAKIIDLGAAFRLNNRNIWEDVYNMVHPDWELSKQAIYGVSELHLEEIKQSAIIANPGCFSSAAILGLAPLIKQEIIDPEHIYINGISGTAGVGAELSRPAHHPEIGNNLVAYNVVDHRHSYEMEQELSLLSNNNVTVHFTPIYAPITRGIMNICHVRPIQKKTRQQMLDMFANYYAKHPFVKIYDMPHTDNDQWQYRPYPWISAIAGTNYCHIGLDIDVKRNRLVIFSVLDSIGKGGAQVGVENMNLMFNLDRTAGLAAYGQHP